MEWFSSEYFFARENIVSIETFKRLLQSLLRFYLHILVGNMPLRLKAYSLGYFRYIYGYLKLTFKLKLNFYKLTNYLFN